jgi:hypothetical protein
MPLLLTPDSTLSRIVVHSHAAGLRFGRVRTTKVQEYRETLRGLESWEAFLLAESGLPGPRANLELVQAAGEEAGESLLLRLADSDDEFPRPRPA